MCCLPCCSCKCVTLILVIVGLVGSVVAIVGTNIAAVFQDEEKMEIWHWVVKNAPLVISFFVHLSALFGLILKKRWLLLPYAICAVLCAVAIVSYLVMISKDEGQLDKTYVQVSMAEALGYAAFLLVSDVFVIYTFLML